MSNFNLREHRDRELLKANSSRNVHDEVKHLTVPELQELSLQDRLPFWVMCLNVLGDLNVGSIIRSSHLFGAEKVVVFGRRRFDSRSLVGAANYIEVEKVFGLRDNDSEVIDSEKFQEFCSTNNIHPLFVEQGGVNVFEFDWKGVYNTCLLSGKKPMLVLGTENSGIPQDILDLNIPKSVLSIPQKGCIRSHNVAMAFATVAGQMIGKLNWY